jgi:N-acetylglutamate synthase-like GNAT family acetyltransferase
MSSGQSYVIRPAASDDVAAATSLVRRSIAELCHADHHNMAAIVEGLLINKTPENMQAWIETPGSYVFVAEAGPIMAGVGGLTGDGEITLLYVAPDFRFQGVSKALLAALEDKAREMGLPNCALVSTDTAQRFFEAHGYAGYDKNEDDFGMDATSMTKNL